MYANLYESFSLKQKQIFLKTTKFSSQFHIFFFNFLQTTNMASLPEKREHLYKILVIGELGTGKTSFIKRYVHQFFSQNYRATIGVGMYASRTPTA